jgi:hypothetical protein
MLMLTARWCDIVLNVQAAGQEVSKIQKEYHKKEYCKLQRFFFRRLHRTFKNTHVRTARYIRNDVQMRSYKPSPTK